MEHHRDDFTIQVALNNRDKADMQLLSLLVLFLLCLRGGAGKIRFTLSGRPLLRLLTIKSPLTPHLTSSHISSHLISSISPCAPLFASCATTLFLFFNVTDTDACSEIDRGV